MPSRKPKPGQPVQTRILLVDDHALVRRGLKLLIETEPGFTVCAEAATRLPALDAIASSKPDLVITDLSFQKGDIEGLELIKDIRQRQPHLPVLVLSMHEETTYAERALRAGARGYVTKQELDETVLVAIRRVLGGGIHMSDAISRRIAQKFIGGSTRAKGDGIETLSDRELEVFKLIGTGQTTRNIAAGLRLSVKTIESYRAHLKVKLGLPSGAELARRATLWVATGSLG